MISQKNNLYKIKNRNSNHHIFFSVTNENDYFAILCYTKDPSKINKFSAQSDKKIMPGILSTTPNSLYWVHMSQKAIRIFVNRFY